MPSCVGGKSVLCTSKNITPKVTINFTAVRQNHNSLSRPHIFESQQRIESHAQIQEQKN